jgi:hypothetical protein
VDGLLGRAALPVDGDALHFLGQPGGQPRGPGDVARLRADRIDAAEDDVVDGQRIKSGPREQGGDHVAAEVGRVRPGKCTTAPAGRRAHRVDDVGLGHPAALPSCSLEHVPFKPAPGPSAAKSFLSEWTDTG